MQLGAVAESHGQVERTVLGVGFVGAIRSKLQERLAVEAADQFTAQQPDVKLFGFSQITDREREVLMLLVEGRSNPEIARCLSISPKTASNHVTNILAKLGVESRTAAATQAVRQGLV